MDFQSLERMLNGVTVGRRPATLRERSQLSFAQLAALQKAEREALWRLSPEQRRLRGGRGELSLHQRSVWLSQAPEEVPMVNDVPVWLARTLCDIVDEGEED